MLYIVGLQIFMLLKNAFIRLDLNCHQVQVLKIHRKIVKKIQSRGFVKHNTKNPKQQLKIFLK